MQSTLAAALDAARVRAFVGRESELAAFDAALACHGTHRVVFVHGPGGIGKTALRHQFRIRATLQNHPVVELDARDIDCSPGSFRVGFDRAHLVARGTGPLVLLLDGYERLAPIDDWMRTEFLPSLPNDAVVAVFGSTAPSPAWRTDPGWRALATLHRLGELSDFESLDLLDRFAVPAAQQARLAGLGRGHPLTLALLADSAAITEVLPRHLADAPDLVSALVPQIVDEAPDEAHALGYALCAMAWLTTEDLLARTVGERAGEVWSWLARRPFITLCPDGLYPHDLVREILDADLRRRTPERYRTVHRIVHQQAIDGLRGNDTAHHELWALQKLYLHRHSPLTGSFWVLRERGAAAVERGRDTDHPEIIDMVRHLDGEQNALIAARWLAAQPDGLSLIRSPTGVAGFYLQVLYPADPALVDTDPVVRAAVDIAATTSPARPGEQLSIGRFLAGRKDYQRDAYAVVAACVGSTIFWIRRPLAWSFVATVDPEFWTPALDYLGFTPRTKTEFEGREYTIYGIDWRRVPVDVWLDVMSERELTGGRGPIPAALQHPAPLSRDQFDDAVRVALRELSRPDRLGHNALTGSRLIPGGTAEPETALRAVLLAGIERVGRQQRSLPLGHVLDRTFVHAAPTQEAAAEVLDLPFSTYRRHLARAVDELTDVLWSMEIGRPGG